MTQLIDILQLPQFSNMTDTECLTQGNILVALPQDHTPYTWSGIGEMLVENGVTPTELVQFYSGITTLPGGAILDKCLSSGGFDFADQFNVATITSFEINEPDWAVSVLNAMLAIGSPQGTTWQLYGVAQPSLSDITSALATLASQLSTSIEQTKIQTFIYTNINPLITQNLTASNYKIALTAALNAWST